MNSACQFEAARMSWPMPGAAIGAMNSTMVTSDIRLAMRRPT